MFIKEAISISPQKTYTNEFLDGEVIAIESDRYIAIEPDYMGLIPNNLLRRMGKAVRMGIGAGMPLIQKYPNLDGIILGTANGGLEDCIKFLNQLVAFEEGVLTPTNFVQSTPNAVTGQLAMMSTNRGYNMTHTHSSLAFETALVDADLFLSETSTTRSLLLGGLEEISDYNYNIDFHNNLFKQQLISNTALLSSKDPGSYCGEGANFFVCSNAQDGAVMRLVANKTACFRSTDSLSEFVESFLQEQNENPIQPSILISGWNGDSRLRALYEQVEQRFSNATLIHFKHLCGEYRTAVSFGTYLAFQLFSGKCTFLNTDNKSATPDSILLYNTFDGFRHSLLLFERV
jgi:hypothetical protein